MCLKVISEDRAIKGIFKPFNLLSNLFGYNSSHIEHGQEESDAEGHSPGVELCGQTEMSQQGSEKMTFGC